jgi:hypothetical protein
MKEIREKEQDLKQFFKNNKDSILVGEIKRNGFIDKYVVSRRLSGRGIELYKQTVDADDPSRSFGGGVTLAKGSFYVAQYVLGLEESGIVFDVELLN